MAVCLALTQSGHFRGLIHLTKGKICLVKLETGQKHMFFECLWSFLGLENDSLLNWVQINKYGSREN